MIVNRALLGQADIGFQTRFNLAIEAMRGKTYYELMSMVIPSTHRSEVYPWVTALPQMKEWVDDAVFANLEAYKFTIENKFWQAGLQVKREDLEDDNLGIVQPALDMLGQNAARHPDKLIFNLLMAGFAATYGLAYDGQYFFDTDHKDGSGATLANKGTAALATVSFQNAIVDMASITDEFGESLEITPTHLFVAPANRAVALNIIETEQLASGASNINFKAVNVVVVPRLSAHPAYWFLMDLSKPLKPFIFQSREPLKFAQQDKDTDDNAFMRRLFRWSTWARYNAGYAMWQLAWGSDGTT